MAAAFFDCDKDGDLDLIVGDEDGRVALVENTAKFTAENTPQFLKPAYFQQHADELKDQRRAKAMQHTAEVALHRAVELAAEQPEQARQLYLHAGLLLVDLAVNGQPNLELNAAIRRVRQTPVHG